jgi:CheY-like chemotaxis protein
MHDHGVETLAGVAPSPDLIVIGLDMPALSGAESAEIRAYDGAIGRVPIIAFGGRDADPDDLLAAGVDVVLPDSDPDTLVRAAEDWRPEPLPPGFTKLQEIFGEAQAMALLGGLRSLLIDALRDFADDGSRDLAHRVAGMAGMLGFAGLGQSWLAVSEGEEVDAAALRHATRRAIVAIDRAL